MVAKGKFEMDWKSTPPVMTVTEEEGQNVGRAVRAIVEKTATGWRACYALDSSDLPKAFKVGDGGGILVARYERKAGSRPKPLRALLITGGCCHEYDAQAVTLMQGISQRANVEFTLVRDKGADGTQHKVSAYQKADWAAGYDIVLHNECYADEKDPAWLEGIVAPHRAGTPAVVIHCAMHCYRAPTNEWFRFVGVTSRSHGSHFAYPMTNVKPEHPVMKGFPAVWQTPKEELYIIEKVEKEATPLAVGYSHETKKGEANVWVHQYGKARVFGTTMGHYNHTMSDPVYLDLITRGTLWATGKLQEDGSPVAGYGPAK
jgi:type 1 glutamine amidotransferase